MIKIINFRDIDPSEILDRKENVFNVADAVADIIKEVRARTRICGDT